LVVVGVAFPCARSCCVMSVRSAAVLCSAPVLGAVMTRIDPSLSVHPYLPVTSQHTCSFYLPSHLHPEASSTALLVPSSLHGIGRLVATARRSPFGGTLCSPCHRRSAPHALSHAVRVTIPIVL